jgi:hypothetical protein
MLTKQLPIDDFMKHCKTLGITGWRREHQACQRLRTHTLWLHRWKKWRHEEVMAMAALSERWYYGSYREQVTEVFSYCRFPFCT